MSSWWDASSISSLASQALKNAQKKIDKVLDIEADEKSGKIRKKKEGSASLSEKTDAKQETSGSGQDFWSGWMGKHDEEKKDDEGDAATSPSHLTSWHLPWASPSQESQASPDTGAASSLKSSAERRAAARRSLLTPRKKDAAKQTSAAAEASSSSQLNNQEESLLQRERELEEPEEEKSHSMLEDDARILEPNSAVPSAESSSSDNVPETQEQNVTEICEETPTRNVDQNVSENISENPPPEQGVGHEDSHEDQFSENPMNNLKESHFGSEPICETMSVKDNYESGPASSEARATDLSAPLVQENQDLDSAESGWQDADADVILDEDTGVDDNDESFSVPSQSQPVVEPMNFSQSNVIESSNAEFSHSDVSREAVEASVADSNLQQTDTADSASQPHASHIEAENISPENIPHISTSTAGGSPTNAESDSLDGSDQTSAQCLDNAIETNDSSIPAICSGGNEDFHTISKPDFAEESASVSSDVSLIGFPDHRSVENIEDVNNGTSHLAELGGGEKSLSQEYVNVGSISGSSQVLSLDGSTDDCLQSSSEQLDLTGVSASSVSDLDPAQDQAGSTESSSDTGRLDSSADTVVVVGTTTTQHDTDAVEHGYSLFNSDGATQEKTEEFDGASPDPDQSPPSPSSSTYMKSLIQDAMDDLSVKTEDSGSDNHSTGEAKSESSKVDSEMEKSVYSGHESSDDIETTTSSDIEILSAPQSNGEGGAKFHTPFEFSPLRMVQQGAQQHREQLDSRSSSSTTSKAGDGEQLSPERGEGAAWRDDTEFSHHGLDAVKEEGPDSPYHPERLLKKLAEMAEVLQARETKLIQLSKENHSLMEDASILRCQLKKAEEARDAEAADLDALTQEFTLRIGEAEKKMQAVLKEKERYKQQLSVAEKELERRSADVDVEAMLEEKRQQVEELLQEGEKLSKQQLQSSTIIKKLRAKEKESDTTITSQKKKLEDQTAELEHLRNVLDSKEDLEKKQTEAITQLNNAVQKQEKDLAKIRSDLEDAQEKSRGLQLALDNSYKEIAELHKSNATQDSKAQEAALSAETHVREELRAAMEREQMRFKQERESFIMQADDLRLDMARLEKEHSRREDLLREEIAHLQRRLQEDEARSQDLTQSVSSATRPLLRQIENLQATYGAQASAWERVEKNLTDRLAEAQTSLAVAQEKERTSNQHYMDLSAKVAALEAANMNLRQEKATLTAKIEGDKSRLEELQDTRNSVVAQLESSKKTLSEETTQLKMDKVHLESQLTVERARVETEKKKSVALEEQLRLAERPRSRGTPSPSPSMSVSRQESIAGSIHEGYPGNMMNWSFHQDESDSGSTVGVSRASVYDSLRQSGAAIVVENMSSQLKLREGEITQLQSEISRLERTRESMARELVNLSNQNEELQETKVQYDQLQEQYKELNQRYSAILQMYGEKEEQVQELRLDLQDVKEMYKTQIDALMAK